MIRRVLFWSHLSAGVLASLLILFFSITGSLLAFERQIVNAADTSYGKAMPTASEAKPLPMDRLLALATPGIPEQVQSITLSSDPSALVAFQTDNRDVYLIDPYTGKVQGPASPRARAFFDKVTGLHRWFGLGNASHSNAMVVKGTTVLLFVYLIFSGAILWIPARWTRTNINRGMVPKFGLRGRARNYNWHKVTGLWLSLPLAIIAGTGVIMALPWANALLFHIAGSPVPVHNGPPNAGHHEGGREHAHEGSHGAEAQPHLDAAFAQAASSVAGWQTVNLRLAGGGPALNFTVDRSGGGHPNTRVQVVVEKESLQVTRKTEFADQTRGQQWRGWVRFLHTGEAGGWWGEGIACIAALGAALLSVTGLLLSLNRLQRFRAGTSS